MPPYGCYYSSYMPHFTGYPYMNYGYPHYSSPMHRPYDRFEYAIGNFVGGFLGECFANYFGPVSNALMDVSRYKGCQAAENIYKYYGLA